MGLFTSYVGRLVAGVGSRIINLTPYGNPLGRADDKLPQSRTVQDSLASGNSSSNGESDTETATSSSQSTIPEIVASEGEDEAPMEVSHRPQASDLNKSLTPISNLLHGITQAEEPKLNSQLFALIIGINKYTFDTTGAQDASIYRGQKPYSPEAFKLPSFTNLRGAVADARHFYKYLTSDLGVPSEHLTLLCDEQATRAGIIKAFQELGERQNIRRGDSIVIFYAGHGAQALPPKRLSDVHGCPKYVELLVPYDYGKDPKNHQSMGIPDYTLAALVNGIAEKKGDNITVIFDCCHSASSLRGAVSKASSDNGDSLNHPITRSGPELNYHIPDDLDVDIWGGKRGLTILPRLRHVGAASYVFFAACASNELAKENDGRGYFTSALLSLLQEVGSRTLTCSQIISRLGKVIKDQSPQCEGGHTNRGIFHGFSPSYRKRFFSVNVHGRKYIVNAGTLDGLSQGDELTVYKTQSEDDQKIPVTVFVVEQASNRTSLLKFRDQAPSFDLSSLPNPAPALLTKSAQSRLRLYISAEQSNHVERLVSLVNRLQTNGTITITTSESERPTAHIALSTDDGIDLRFDVVDPDLNESRLHHFKYEDHSSDESLARILRGLSDYYWHLTRTPPVPSIPPPSAPSTSARSTSAPSSPMPSDSEISISFCELYQDNASSANPLFSPRGKVTELHNGDVINLDVDFAPVEGAPQAQDEFDDPDEPQAQLYGLEVTNKSREWDLYPALFYFDNSEFTITPIYQPPLGSQKAESPLKKMESITIGYGAVGTGVTVRPLYFTLPEGRKMDIGFLKLILSTEPINLQDMVQETPLFETTRALGKAPIPSSQNKSRAPNWSSFTFKVIQRLRED